MKVHKVETVTRYQVTFDPRETALLLADEKWCHVVSTKCSVHNGTGGMFCAATLTKAQINQVCDLLGVNGREWFAAQGLAPA